jgi:hypothetical protein
MRPLSEMPAATAAGIHTIFTDIDDTMTSEGRLPAEAYSALEALKEAGLNVAPITGRPGGWCDMIARFWPVDGVVGENGAFYFAYDGRTKKMRRVFSADALARDTNRARLAPLGAHILAEVPGTAISADQGYREADLAIDFAEDVTPLPMEQVQRIKAIFEAEGGTAKISSIHVNGWFGSYDKLTMARRFAAEILSVDIDAERERIIFCGDSPNDAPMFAHFPNACGVANVRDFAGTLEAEPRWVSEGRGGAGFAEIARRLLDARAGKRRSA